MKTIACIGGLVLMAGTASAAEFGVTTIHSVQPGNWQDASTWDIRVPQTVSDLAILQHSVSVYAPGNSTGEFEVGAAGQPGVLQVFDGATLDATFVGRVGQTGGQSRLSIFPGGLVTAPELHIGTAGDALVELNGAIEVTSGLYIGADAGVGELRVFFNQASVSVTGELVIGANGILKWNGSNEGPPMPIDVDGDVTLLDGWQFPIDEHEANSMLVGDTIGIINYTGDASVSPPAPSFGLTWGISLATPGVVELFVVDAPTKRFTNPGAGDWHTGPNWEGGTTPPTTGQGLIENGGTAQITSPATIKDVSVGLFGGDGHLEVNGSALTVTNRFRLGAPSGTYAHQTVVDDIAASFDATDSSLWFQEVRQGAFGTEDSSGTSTIDTDFTMSGGLLFVAESFEIGAPFAYNQSTASITSIDDCTFENVSSVHIGESFNISNEWFSANEDTFMMPTVTIDNVAEFRTVEDLNIGDVDSDGLGDATCVANISITDSLMIQLGDVDVSNLRNEGPGDVDATATVTLDSSTWLVTEEISIAKLLGGGGSSDNNSVGTVSLIDTDVRTGALEVGLHADATPGTLEGRLEMSRSYLETDPLMLNGDFEIAAEGGSFELGEHSTLQLRIEGLVRATPANVGTAGIYSALDVRPSDDVMYSGVVCELGGTLELIFDFAGVAEGDSFDLIANQGDIDFTGAFDQIVTSGLPAGYGIAVEQDADLFRIVITTGCAEDISGDGAVDTADLLDLIGQWGPCSCAADINGDGVVDTADLLMLIGAWGTCAP